MRNDEPDDLDDILSGMYLDIAESQLQDIIYWHDAHDIFFSF